MAGTIKLDGTTFLTKDSSNNFTLDVGSGGSISQGTIGSNVTFPTGTITNYVYQTTQPTGTQVLDTNYQDIVGALISSYTPTTGASQVYYSVNVRTSHGDDHRGIGSFMLFLDGVGQGGETGFTVDNSLGTTTFGQYITYHALISTSGWTSGKDVVLKAREYSSSYDVQLHYNPNHHQQDGGTDAIRYNKVYTIIYSIM